MYILHIGFKYTAPIPGKEKPPPDFSYAGVFFYPTVLAEHFDSCGVNGLTEVQAR
jgi:hypothetical protein